MNFQHIQLQYLCRPAAAQQAAKAGIGAPVVAVHKLLDVRAGLHALGRLG